MCRSGPWKLAFRIGYGFFSPFLMPSAPLLVVIWRSDPLGQGSMSVIRGCLYYKLRPVCAIRHLSSTCCQREWVRDLLALVVIVVSIRTQIIISLLCEKHIVLVLILRFYLRIILLVVDLIVLILFILKGFNSDVRYLMSSFQIDLFSILFLYDTQRFCCCIYFIN